LGRFGSAEAKRRYTELIAEWLSRGRPAERPKHRITVVELLAAYLEHARGYYQKDGQPTKHLGMVKLAIREFRAMYGREPADAVGPLAIAAFQERLIERGRTPRGKQADQPPLPLARGYVNKTVAVIRLAFKWGVSRELIPASVHVAISTAPGLRKGRSKAREPGPVLPIDDATFEATLPHLPPVVADLVRLIRLTGARPTEACQIRPGDVDTSSEPWIYKPASHKNAHRDQERRILLGPRARAILGPYLNGRGSAVFCFSPTESEQQRLAELRARRKTRVQPSQQRRAKSRQGKDSRRPGLQFSKDSLNWAIRRACKRARVATWSAGRLRHDAATTIRAEFGLEATAAILGHARVETSQIYAEKNAGLAASVAEQIG